MEITNFSMGDIIRSIRKSRGCTQDALAQAVGISVQAVSKWETGASLPDVTLLPSIADFLDISIDTLFNRAPFCAEKEPSTQVSPSLPTANNENTLHFSGSLTADQADGGTALDSLFSSVSNCVSSLFQNKNSRADIFFGDALPDDDIIRVVQLRGRRILSTDEASEQNFIRLSVENPNIDAVNVEIYGSAQILGNVSGSVTADDDVTCGNIGGSVTAGDNVTCGNIDGSVTAGDSVTCNEIHGSVNADTVKYKSGKDGQPNDSVHRSEQIQQQKSYIEQLKKDLREQSEQLRRQMEQQAQHIKEQHAKLTESMSSRTKDIPDLSAYNNGALNILQIMNGRILSAYESDAHPIRLAVEDACDLTVHIHGNAEISGDIGGDVHSKGNVRCNIVEGDINAGGVTCGNVEGDVNAGGVTCGNVEGDVNAGGVTCENISGDVRAEGSVNCKGSIEGDVSSGGSITCGDIGGDVRADTNITCANVEGDVTAYGSFRCEGNIEGDVYRR